MVRPHLASVLLAKDDRIQVKWDEIPADVHGKIQTLTALVLTTIAALVEHEDDIQIQVQANHRRVMFTIRVPSDDVGLAIGSQGRHADALRTLLIAACRKLKFHFDMDIGGPSGSPDWSSD